MKLVSVHKHIFIFLLLLSWNTIQAQEVWTLKQCIDSAQVYNKNLQVNRNNITIGEERQKEAKSNLIPKVFANADYKYFTNLPHQLMPMSTFNPAIPEGQFREVEFGVPHNINANIQLAMPLYNPNIYGGIQASKIASQLTELQYQKTEEQVYFEVSNLYYNAQILQHQLAFIDSNLINAQRLLRNMELLHEQLLVKGTDVNKVKLERQQLQTQRENVNNKYVQILNALKLTIGIELNNEIAIEKDIHFPRTVNYAQKSSLDLQMLQIQNKLLNTELKTLNKTRYLPTLNLVASYGVTGFGYDKSPNEFLNFYPVGFAGIQFSYPLFNGMVTHRKVNQKKLEIENNELQVKLIAEKNEVEIENAVRQRNIAQQTVAQTKDQIELAQTIYNQTILQQRQGTASLTDVLLANNSLRMAQQDYLNAIVDYLKGDLELKKLTGNIVNYE